MPKRVVLAMSGGVDSSVAALLLKQAGHEVIGLFMRTGAQAEEDACDSRPPDASSFLSPVPSASPRKTQPSHKKGCCSSLDAADARRVADRLDIPFYALDFQADFGRIIDYFVDEYVAGRTPNPCVMCNNWLKFGKLWAYGKQLGADFIATGHYARIVAMHGRHELHMAADPAKDQSYVLFGIRPNALPRLLFPVGGYRKDEIRRIAEDAGLAVFNKPDSQEICFVPDGDYAGFVRRHRPEAATAGTIVNTAGAVLAEHSGIEQFTVGQRKGLGFAAGARRYVLQIVPKGNTVVVGTRDECLSAGLIAEQVNWLIDPPENEPRTCQVKIRYRSQPVPADMWALADGQARVEFATPQAAVTPGQAAVFYDGPRVLGGGWIARAD